MDPKHFESGVSQAEEAPEVVESESMSMDEQIEAISDSLIDLPEDEPQPAPDPAPVEDKPDKEPAPASTPEEVKPEPVAAPSFLNEQEKAEFAALPRTQQEAIARVGSGAQKQITQTQQQLAQERNRIAAVEGIWQNMQRDPNYANHVLQGYQPVQQEPEKPTFDDPVAELEYNAAEKAKAELRKEWDQREAEQTQNDLLRRQAEVKAELSRDERHGEVMDLIQNKVMNADTRVDPMDPHGRTFQQLEYLRLDNDPDYFKAEFGRAKEWLLSQEEKPPAPEVKPAPVQTQERAPILEAAGPATEPQEIAQRKAHKRMKADALRNGGLEDIGGYLYKSGLLDHLA